MKTRDIITERTYLNTEVLKYVKKRHKEWHPDLDYIVMDHEYWDLDRIPLSMVKVVDDDISSDDPYNRIIDINPDHVDDIYKQDIESKPIVIDHDGVVIDGNHRAVKAKKLGLTHIPAYYPIKDDINEDSPDTPAGSQSEDLNLGKLYLCRCLKRLGLDKFKKVYALGSWYGSIAQYILDTNIDAKSIVLIDIDPKNTAYVEQNRLNERVHAVTADCNQVKLDSGPKILVVNTSTNDISGQAWFDNIAPGTYVALQGRDQQWDNKENLYQTIESFDSAFPLSETYCLSEMPLTCAEGTEYNRFTKIGRK